MSSRCLQSTEATNSLTHSQCLLRKDHHHSEVISSAAPTMQSLCISTVSARARHERFESHGLHRLHAVARAYYCATYSDDDVQLMLCCIRDGRRATRLTAVRSMESIIHTIIHGVWPTVCCGKQCSIHARICAAQWPALPPPRPIVITP